MSSDSSASAPAMSPVKIERVHGVTLVTLAGWLDAINAPAFDAQVTTILKESCSHIVLDLSGLVYIGSMALRSVQRLIRRSGAHSSRTGMFGANAHVTEVFEISGFRRLLDVYPDRESALRGSSA